MNPISTIDDAFDVGTWVGRRQAFALVAGRCAAADGDVLYEIRERKLFLTIEKTWEDFCVKRVGLSRSYVDRIIRQSKELGPDYSKLSCFTRITPAEYRLIAGAVTEDGLAYGGEVIPLAPENAPKLTQAVEALHRDSIPPADPVDPVEQAFAKAEKAVKSAIAEFQRLQAMKLDDDGRLKLVIALESCRNQVDLIHMSTNL
ncbi:conserved hypothetical protein [Candidatus Sulfopaludibacter sp. SbA4]|nr:conserved hypothetical protein [Candidatus Sulfopaludibacter sp. SbA4]